MSLTIISSPHFVWGGSEPLPPALAEGWEYIADPQEWLLVRDLRGNVYFVACVEGDYVLYPRRVALYARGMLKVGDFYVDLESPSALPVLEGSAQ